MLALALSLLALAPGHGTPSLASSFTPEDYTVSAQRFTFYLGGRALDDDFEPVEHHGMFGFEYSDQPEGSAVGFEVGLQFSYDEDEDFGADVEAAAGEIYGGVCKRFGSGRLLPVLGAGLSLVTVVVDAGPFDDDDSSLAGYVHGGLGLAVGSNLSLGIDARYLFGSELEFGGFEADADYAQFALFLGVGL